MVKKEEECNGSFEFKQYAVRCSKREYSNIGAGNGAMHYQ